MIRFALRGGSPMISIKQYKFRIKVIEEIRKSRKFNLAPSWL